VEFIIKVYGRKSILIPRVIKGMQAMLQYSRKEIRMAQKKIDGVIEAVRYTPGGSISVVRTYQRRGAVWSDRILLGRPELVEQLKSGKIFVTGARKEFLGGVFKTGSTVRYIDQYIVTEGQTALRDLLAGVSVF
jgi:hypothetical protein